MNNFKSNCPNMGKLSVMWLDAPTPTQYYCITLIDKLIISVALSSRLTTQANFNYVLYITVVK